MIWIGTSGYNYPEWKGSFYPADLPAAKMLPYYAARFPTVEINYTFYRMPTEKILAGWTTRVPPCLMVRRRGVRASAQSRQGAVRGRQRKAGNAPGSDRGVRLLPPARRR